MSKRKRKRVPPCTGELSTVRCRVCRKEINYQFYTNHLEVSHPDEDSNYRREAGQTRLFGGIMVKKVVQEEVKEQEKQDKSDEDVTMEKTSETFEVKDMEEEVIEIDPGEIVNNNVEEEERSVVDTKEVKDIILQILISQGAEVSFEDCTTEEEKLNKCLFLVSKRLKVKKEATNLVNMLEELKLVEGRGDIEEKVEETQVKDEQSVNRLARNLEELTEVGVLRIQEAGKQVVCVLPCHQHYKGFQSALAVLAIASVAMGLESVVESWVSVMEHHNNPSRPLIQARLEQECMVAINGPKEV